MSNCADSDTAFRGFIFRIGWQLDMSPVLYYNNDVHENERIDVHEQTRI